ncbi:MAG: nucleotidyltransferase family protein [Chloroflexi bacterium]|nr:nucleotidyltransferase family protein [Chloroflexota bacterium]
MRESAISTQAKAARHSLDNILPLLRGHTPELRERYAVRSLGVFGSYVHGEATADSDLDLLVEYERVPTLFEFVRLQRHLSEFLDIPVDLVMKTALKPAIGQTILAEVMPI